MKTFQLCYRPPIRARRTGNALLLTYLHKEKWTREDVDKIQALIDDIDQLSCDAWDEVAATLGVPNLLERMIELVAEYKRIAVAPMLPSVAYLRRQIALPSTEDRAIAIYRRIEQKISLVYKDVQLLHPYPKTRKAQIRWQEKWIPGHVLLLRLRSHHEYLKSKVHDVAWLASKKTRGVW